MAHDEHFLERLDRVSHQHVELALGLYRDHALVKAILADARLRPEDERVALALEDGGDGPHLVVARDGGFVTCLGKGMSTGALPILSRAHIDGLATRVERVREGLALARKRGVTQTELLKRLESEGGGVSREDFVAASAMVGPAVPLLLGTYTSWATALDEMFPLLSNRLARSWDPARRRRAEQDLARGAWAMAHSAMVTANSVSREWVDDWGKLSAHETMSPWTFMTMASAFPIVIRAAWVAGRLGKPMFASYKARYCRAINSLDLREAGLGLACMGLRHASLRAEAMRTLRSPPPHDTREAWVGAGYTMFKELPRLVEEKEEALRAEGLTLGRDIVVLRTSGKPEGARHRYTTRDEVPEELALPGLFDAWHDANNGERSGDLLLLGLVAASRARAEDFYFPASVLHGMDSMTLQEAGALLVEMRRKLVAIPQPVRHAGKPGRNDACPCGSGKKYKKCHGA
jgi:hypothetical protein